MNGEARRAIFVLFLLIATVAACDNTEQPGPDLREEEAIRIYEGWVNATALNVRSGPGLGYSVVGQVFCGDEVRAVDSYHDWLQIKSPIRGWVHSHYLKSSLPLDCRVKEATTPSVARCPGGCTLHKPGCDIKGNVSFDSGEKIYHAPGQEYYDETVINPRYGERWFCTEQEALDASWRKAFR